MRSNAVQMPQTSNPDRLWMVFLRSVGTLLLGIGALAVSVVTYQTQKKNTERDLDLKQQTFQLQTDLESAKMAISVIPMMNCADDTKRESALQVLDTFRPTAKDDFKPAAKYKQALMGILSSKCQKLTAQERSELSDFQRRAAAERAQTEFQRTLANAREYRKYGFDGPASRVFYEAGPIPKAYEGQVDMTELTTARSAYEQGDFSEASERFQRAFSRVP